MKKLLVLFICVIAIAQTHAQDKLDLQTNPWSIQFKVTQDYLVSAFDSKAFSIKKQVSPTSAYRLGFTPSFRDESGERTYTYTADTSGVVTSNSSITKSDNYKIGMVMEFLYLKNLKLSHPIYPYFGAGPMVSYLKSETKRLGHKSVSESTRFGGVILVGVEFRFKKNFGLFAEYQSELSYYKTTRYEDRTSGLSNGEIRRVSNDETSGYRIYNAFASMGLSVYF